MTRETHDQHVADGREAFDKLTGERPLRNQRDEFARAYADIAGWPHTGRFARVAQFQNEGAM